MTTLPRSIDQIIKTRRSTRSFTKEIPSTENLMKIIESAIYAPYGGATGIPLEQLRKVFIFKQDTDAMEKAREILLLQARKNAKKLNWLLTIFPFLKKKMQTFANKVNGIAKGGVPALNHAAYFIVLAEKKGFPPVEKQSMAHAFENMWITATEMGLGFQLISVTNTLSNNEDFLRLLNLRKGKYTLDGCAIGYSKGNAKKIKEFDVKKFITWIE